MVTAVFAVGMKRSREDPPISESTEEKPQPPLAPAPITESTELEVIDLTEDPFFFSDRVSSFLASTFGPAMILVELSAVVLPGGPTTTSVIGSPVKLRTHTVGCS